MEASIGLGDVVECVCSTSLVVFAGRVGSNRLFPFVQRYLPVCWAQLALRSLLAFSEIPCS